MAASRLTPRGLDLRRATVAALVATVVLGAVSDLLFLAALQARPDWFADPARLVAAGEPSATLLGWAALADLCGYYLPTLVVALALWAWLRGRAPLIATGALIGAIAYVIAGSMAAASLAVAGPDLMRAFATPGADQAAIAGAFGLLVDVAVRAIWQLLDGIFIATWMIGTGLLVRHEQPGFARLSIGLGALFLLVAAFEAVGLGLPRDATLAIIFTAWFAWDAWLALLVWQRRQPFAEQPAPGSLGPALAGRPLNPDLVSRG